MVLVCDYVSGEIPDTFCILAGGRIFVKWGEIEADLNFWLSLFAILV